MKENELLPCPFCGYDEPEIGHNQRGDEFYIYCPTCYSRTGTYDQNNGLVLAINAWNRRDEQ